VLGACAALLVIASMVSFGRFEFFSEFLSYGGKTNSFFDLVYDVFYETILPLNGFIVCLFVTYRWRKSNMDKELMTGDDGYDGSFTQRYVNFALSTFIPAILLFVFISTVLLKFFGISVL
jgi:NSS family neurotransmitter:Na+ symporter